MTGTSFHIPRIETGRLILRAPQGSDLARLTTFERDGELLGKPCLNWCHPNQEAA